MWNEGLKRKSEGCGARASMYLSIAEPHFGSRTISKTTLRLLALRPRIATGVPLIGDAHALYKRREMKQEGRTAYGLQLLADRQRCAKARPHKLTRLFGFYLEA